jgi:hypothetical protein
MGRSRPRTDRPVGLASSCRTRPGGRARVRPRTGTSGPNDLERGRMRSPQRFPCARICGARHGTARASSTNPSPYDRVELTPGPRS